VEYKLLNTVNLLCSVIVFLINELSFAGRQGAPKTRNLQCDDEVTELIIQASDHYKKIPISEIDGIRLGNEIDPITPAETIARFNAEQTEGKEVEKLMKRRSTMSKFLGSSKDEVLFGTAILRRTCKPEDMHLSFSLLMQDR
jgi:hypothetical protein